MWRLAFGDPKAADDDNSLLIALFLAQRGFACFFSLRLWKGLLCAAAHEPFEYRRGHERRDNRHDYERGEKSIGYDAALQTDVNDDQLHQSAGIHQRADAERFAI